MSIYEIAQLIAEDHIQTIDFSSIYEDEAVIDLELSDLEMSTIHNLIINAKVVLPE